ncbi:MAG: biotin--[acetyl-CoA-carboxylase] ligase, partial [Alphaproteobacteria bacterium]|nr:biotin--[acetyl-CoA-carboxylase] ligase [Alphaproteobacteria bacterium]
MPEPLPPGYTLKVHESLPSTNDEARRLAESESAGHGTAVMALTQTAGRGRRGRSWVSEPGNLFFSLLLRPKRPVSEVATLSFVASLAVRDMLARWVDPDELSLKWPNDVLLSGRKVCGILLEGVSGAEGLNGVIVGIGVNLRHAPENVIFPAIALSEASPSEVPEPEEAARALLARFAPWYQRWEEAGFAAVGEAWLSH